MEEDEAKKLIKNAEYLKPERKALDKVRVHYLNLPKRFVAGTVYDPDEKEVIIGATCTLRDNDGGQLFKVETDCFGDFWFHGLADGIYSLKIEAKGFAARSFDKLNTEKDINLGDIPLSR